jgi:STE24 endopeptidase
MSSRGTAVVTLLVLVAALAVAAALLIPWREAPAPRADQLAALRSLPAAQVAKGREFSDALRPNTYTSMAVGLVVALVLGFTPLGARIVSAFGRGWVTQALFGGLAIVFLSSLATLPFGVWRETTLRRFGLSTQTWASWTIDQLKSYAITAVLGGLLLLGFYGLVRIAPKTWWAWAAGGAAALVVLLSFVLPVVFEPIFNKFTPMADGPLRSDLVAMAARDGVPVKDVLVADASRRTRAVNAYVSGFGPTRRIVVYDTLLEQATPAEVESVVAHELGHAKDNDVFTGTLLGAIGAAIGVIAVYLLGSWTWLLNRAGVDDIASPRAIGLLLALSALAGLVSGPALNYVSRHIEARADTHALQLTDDPDTFAAMQARLSELNLANPDPNPVDYFMFASHPSTVQRIAAARAFGRLSR